MAIPKRKHFFGGRVPAFISDANCFQLLLVNDGLYPLIRCVAGFEKFWLFQHRMILKTMSSFWVAVNISYASNHHPMNGAGIYHWQIVYW